MRLVLGYGLIVWRYGLNGAALVYLVLWSALIVILAFVSEKRGRKQVG